MPQLTQHCLIHVLLLWTTILSIIQAVFIILFFTTGLRGLSQNSSDVAPQRTAQFQANITPSPPPSDRGLFLGKGRMFSYKATEVNGKIKWLPKYPRIGLVSEKGEDLLIKKDGYYFLLFQVTLNKDKCPCNGTIGSQCMVLLKWNNEILLQGRINTNTCSTGLIGRVKGMAGGDILEFTVNMPPNNIDETESLTYLDIIYMLNQ